jgi:hypothetical protein
MRYLIFALLTVLVITARAEVQSITVGIDVNSPYGLGEPWAIIREGLLRLDYVEWVSPQPDRKTRTGELRTKEGRLPDLDVFASAIRDIGAGASLRGVEVTVAGNLEKHAEIFMLRASKTGELLLLEPLTEKVQFSFGKPLPDEEKKAFQELTAQWKQKREVQLTGPVRKAAPKAEAILQVRLYRP